MKTWIIAIGIFFLLLTGCGQNGTQSTVATTPEGITIDATRTQTVIPEATPTLDETTANETRAQMIIPDLKTVPEGKAWKGYVDVAKLVEKEGAAAIEIDYENFNVIWLDGFEFAEGTIEFDAKGKSKPPQGSFVGIVFRVVDEVTYDSVYFRPFNFASLDPQRKAHAVQYVSLPEWPWDRLRAENPGQFEQPVEPAPDGDMWFHVKVVIEEREIKVFVNNAKEPALQVTELSDRSDGSVGLYCYGYGVIANLQISPAK